MKKFFAKLEATALAAAVTMAIPAATQACSHYPMPSLHPTVSDAVFDTASSVFIVEIVEYTKKEPTKQLTLGDTYSVKMAVIKTLKGDVSPDFLTGVEFDSDFPCPRNKVYAGKYRTLVVQNINDDNNVGIVSFYNVKDPEFAGPQDFPFREREQ